MALNAMLNWMPWVAVGDFANVGQLTGVNAVQLIGLIVTAANNARMHKKNCRQFAHHLKLISNLLEQLNMTDLKERSETREPLEQFEDSLRRAVVLVEGCRYKSYLYLVAMGWVYVQKFRDYHNEIDRYLRLIPLISLVEDSRAQKHLKAIEKDRITYELESDEKEVQESLLTRELTRSQSSRLTRQLSKRYPGLPITEALQTENEMLRQELDRLRQGSADLEQAGVIEQLIEFTESAPLNLERQGSSRQGSFRF